MTNYIISVPCKSAAINKTFLRTTVVYLEVFHKVFLDKQKQDSEKCPLTRICKTMTKTNVYVCDIFKLIS